MSGNHPIYNFISVSTVDEIPSSFKNTCPFRLQAVNHSSLSVILRKNCSGSISGGAIFQETIHVMDMLKLCYYVASLIDIKKKHLRIQETLHKHLQSMSNFTHKKWPKMFHFVILKDAMHQMMNLYFCHY